MALSLKVGQVAWLRWVSLYYSALHCSVQCTVQGVQCSILQCSIVETSADYGSITRCVTQAGAGLQVMEEHNSAVSTGLAGIRNNETFI